MTTYGREKVHPYIQLHTLVTLPWGKMDLYMNQTAALLIVTPHT
jgi:hypothetical protein